MKDFLSDSTFFSVALSLITYKIGTWLKTKTGWKIVNPLLVSILVVIVVLLMTRVSYEDFEKGSEILSYLLTPATVALAVPVYRQIYVLKKYGIAVSLGVLAGVLTSLISTLLVAVFWNLSHEEYVTLLPKTITTAIGMSISENLGGMVTVTVAVIVVTGIVGNGIGEMVCRICKIREEVAIGVALGTSAHAMGTAKALEMGEVQGAVSSLAIVLAGIFMVLGGNVFAALY